MVATEQTVDDLPIKPGDVLAGKYRVERILGSGGMGIVVAARHTDLGELRAVKFLREQVKSDESVERFMREARAAVRLKSAHVVKVHDVGRLESGSPYMVMELLEGEDLKQLLAHGRLLPVQDCVDILLQALEAMAEAHGNGIIHRDIKPANLFVTTDADGERCVKVLDFGISKLLDNDDQMEMTATHALMGSPYYMSPEQMMSTRNVDMRTDVWSLGVVLYEMLTGTVPFKGRNIAAQCALLLQKTAPAPSHIAARELPPGLDEAVLACLKREPPERAADVAQLAASLVPFGGPDAAKHARRIERFLNSGRASRSDISSDDLALMKTVSSARAKQLADGHDVSTLRSEGAVVAPDSSETTPTISVNDRSPMAPPGQEMSQSTKASWSTLDQKGPVKPAPGSRGMLVAIAIACAGLGAGLAAVVHMNASDETAEAAPAAAPEAPTAAAAEPALQVEPEPAAEAEPASEPAASEPTVAPTAAPTVEPSAVPAAKPRRSPTFRRPPVPRPPPAPKAQPSPAEPKPAPKPAPKSSDPFGEGRK